MKEDRIRGPRCRWNAVLDNTEGVESLVKHGQTGRWYVDLRNLLDEASLSNDKLQIGTVLVAI